MVNYIDMGSLIPQKHLPRAFTLIELLVVISIIALLSSVILAALNSARAKGNVAAAESTMHAIVTKMNECLVDQYFPYCYGTAGSHTSSSVCGGAGGSIPVKLTSICGTSGNFGYGANHQATDWPDVGQYGYSYMPYAFGDTAHTKFDFEIKNSTTGDYICCTQNGCQHLTGDVGNGTTNVCRTNAGL